jgi:hypothetical protein
MFPGTDPPLILIVVFALTLMLPGTLLALSAGLKGWSAAAAVPLLTFGLIGIAAPLLPVVDVPLYVSLAILASIASACAVLSRFHWSRIIGRYDHERRPPESEPEGHRRWSVWSHLGVGGALAASAFTGALIVYNGSSRFSGVPQWWDAMFHANAIRYIADTGDTDPSALNALGQVGNPSYYYPNAYHILNAAVLQVVGHPPQLLNASTALVVALFGLSIISLLKQFGQPPALCAAAAILSSAFVFFPYDLIVWGPLFPFTMAVALVPAWLALLAATLDRTPTPESVALLGIASVGLLAIHPSAAFAGTVLACALLLQRWLAKRHVQRRDVLVLLVAGGAVALLGLPLLAGVLGARAGSGMDFPATHAPSEAVGELLTLMSRSREYPQWWLVGISVLGMLRLEPIRSLFWYLIGSASFGILFVLAVSYEGRIVAVLTAPWWNDGWRLAALFTPALLVLAASGCILAQEMILKVGRTMPSVIGSTIRQRHQLLAAPTLVGVLLIVSIGSEGFYRLDHERRVSQLFPDGPVLSIAERDALRRLGDVVPVGSMVMNDPQDGSAWMWALEGVRPAFGAALVEPARNIANLGPERYVLLEHFNEIDENVYVQQAARSLHIEYVYVTEGLLDEYQRRAPGLERLESVESLELVFRTPTAQLYRVRLAPPVEVTR